MSVVPAVEAAVAGHVNMPAAVASVAQASQWATEAELQRILWILIRPGFLITLFLIGWACNVIVFTRFRIDYSVVLGLAKDELVSPTQLLMMGFTGLACLHMVHVMATSQGPSLFMLQSILLMYPVAFCALFAWLPQPLSKRFQWRGPLSRALYRCIFPEEKEVPFVEVLVADGLTSLAKVFYDLTFGACVMMPSSPAPTMPGLINNALLPEQLFDGLVEKRPTLLGDRMDQCSKSVVPFCVLAIPFLIRARQCVITSRHRHDELTSKLDYVNLFKYMTALPAIFFALCHEKFDPKGQQVGMAGFEVAWALAAILNSVCSFMWDLTMDWGFLNVTGDKASVGLRPTLLFREIVIFYYIAVVCNVFGRTMWSLRWSSDASLLLGSLALATTQQVAEVARRCLWNVIRVEWECVKKGVFRSDKTTSCLSL
eukprot:TRINITY_DN41256_c0_g1_i1.p1 TRINITY_DN41256_c0_g1~~TRINITY_DN41256_c0_g1_i1.p1  ORF type:complete len:428 (+),score=54.68 TRINITY_DN41256_c0_g1_i1:62-1345(+)